MKKLSSIISKLGLSKEAEELSALLALASEEDLPKRFPLAFRYWIRDSYYKHNINQTYSPKWKGIIANSLFKKEPEHTRKKIYEAWKLIRDARDDKAEGTKHVVAYHGSNVPIRQFDREKSAMGIFWFSGDKGAIERGERANRTDWLITARLDVGSRIAGWDEYNKLGLYELERQFDSVHLDDDWIIFDPSKIKILKTEKIDRSRHKEGETEGEQLDLFGSLKPDVVQHIQKLSRWLHDNHFQRESLVVLDLIKTSAGKPMPINKAELEAIADELLDKVGDKLADMEPVDLGEGTDRGFSPLDLHDHILDLTPNYFKETNIDPLVSTDPDFAEPEVLEEIKAVERVYESSLDRGERDRKLRLLSKKFNQSAAFLKKQYLDTRSQNLSDYLETSVVKEKKNIKGDDIRVTYTLVFKDQAPGEADSRGAYDYSPEDPSQKFIYIFYSPNRYLHNAILRYQEDSGNFSGSTDSGIGFDSKIEMFKESLRTYIVNTLVHEEVHALDIISQDKRNYEKYEVLSPGGESLEQIAKKLEISGDRLFGKNYNKIIEEVAPFIEQSSRRRAIERLQEGSTLEYDTIYDQVSTELLPEGFRLKVPHRAESQIRIDSVSGPLGTRRTRSLAEIAKQTGLKGGVERLFVINFESLFADSIEGFRFKTYQDIYANFVKGPLYSRLYDKLINLELGEGTEVKLVPSYVELYTFDKGFYVSTKEEFKALITEVMNELSAKLEEDQALDINKIRPEELIRHSRAAQEILEMLQVNPVDELIKTPLGFLDKLKENRQKMFFSGMNHIHYILKDKFEDIEAQNEDLKKEAVLKKKLRKTRGKGKKDRMEWGLFSKSNPKKVLKWFGPKKPSDKEVAKEERRIHSFASNIY